MMPPNFKKDIRTKGEIVASIAALVSAPMPPMAHGSREPKKILCIVNDRLGLGLDNNLSKPDLAKLVCYSAGVTWTPACWSRPMVLTKIGLLHVELAVILLLQPTTSG